MNKKIGTWTGDLTSIRYRLINWEQSWLLLAAVTMAAVISGLAISSSTNPFLVASTIALLIITPIILLELHRNPEWSLTLVVGASFVWYLLPSNVAGIFLGYRTLIAILVIVTVYLSASVHQNHSWSMQRLSLVEVGFLLFTAFMALSVLWSNNPFYGLWKTGLFAATSTFLFILVYRYYSQLPHSIPNLISKIAIVTIVPIVLFIITAYDAAGLRGLTSVWSYDVRIMLSQTSSLVGTSTILMLSVPCVLGAALIERTSWKKTLYYLLLFACLYVILLTGRRVAFVVSIIAVGFFLLAINSQRRWFLIRLAAMFVLVMGGVWLVIQLNPARFIERSVTEDISLVNRIALYRLSLATFLHNPLVGTGIGGFVNQWYSVGHQFGAIIYSSSYAAGDISSGLSRAFSHNILLEILSELGIIGFFLFFTLLLIIVRYMKLAWNMLSKDSFDWKSRVIVAVGLTTVFILFIQAQFSGDLGTLSIGLWLGILVAMVEHGEKGCFSSVSSGAKPISDKLEYAFKKPEVCGSITVNRG